ncbi:unnamed protein product [Closterium sp. Yama58-4]|nr:unnamed protein product [Closterium sp. Yama58-4]
MASFASVRGAAFAQQAVGPNQRLLDKFAGHSVDHHPHSCTCGCQDGGGEVEEPGLEASVRTWGPPFVTKGDKLVFKWNDWRRKHNVVSIDNLCPQSLCPHQALEKGQARAASGSR